MERKKIPGGGSYSAEELILILQAVSFYKKVIELKPHKQIKNITLVDICIYFIEKPHTEEMGSFLAGLHMHGKDILITFIINIIMDRLILPR